MVENAAGSWSPSAKKEGRRDALGVKQLISRAEAACERDEYASALLDLREVLAEHPDFPDIRNQAGVLPRDARGCGRSARGIRSARSS